MVRACREAALCIAGAGLLVSLPAAAQQATRGLEEVVVTAQHREQNLQDVPISVSAIGAQDLNEAQVFGAADTHGFPLEEMNEEPADNFPLSLRRDDAPEFFQTACRPCECHGSDF